VQCLRRQDALPVILCNEFDPAADTLFICRDTNSLVGPPLPGPALLNIFLNLLDPSLVERRVQQGIELLGEFEVLWADLSLAQLLRIAKSDNAQTSGELAWRYALSLGVVRSYAIAVHWDMVSTESSSAEECGGGHVPCNSPREYAKPKRWLRCPQTQVSFNCSRSLFGNSGCPC
jgi:hypothetical protein